MAQGWLLMTKEPDTAPRDWKGHFWDYVAHWLSGGLAGLLTCILPPAGIAYFAFQLVYQLGSYWHKKDTLKLDLKDLLLGYSVGLVLGLPVAGWLAWLLWRHFVG